MKHQTIRHVSGLLLLCAGGLAPPLAQAAGFYLAEVGSPASLGTGGVANPTNTFGADAAWTNPAGMTGLNRDQIYSLLGISTNTRAEKVGLKYKWQK
jgi:long-subunit fatty acid transport protein